MGCPATRSPKSGTGVATVPNDGILTDEYFSYFLWFLDGRKNNSGFEYELLYPDRPKAKLRSPNSTQRFEPTRMDVGDG